MEVQGSVISLSNDTKPCTNWDTSAQHFEDTFEYNEPTDKLCRVGFNLGGDGVNVPFNVEVANLSLIKVNGESTTVTTASNTEETTTTTTKAVIPSDKTGVNLCENAKNWSSWVYEEAGASADVTKLDNGIRVSVNNGGTDVWYVQGNYANITLEKGAKYRLEFDYSANKNASLGVNVQQNYEPYGQYYYDYFDYTTSEQHFSSTFTMTDDTDDNAVIVFNYGGEDIPSGFTASVTNLSLVKIS